jgi:hypothetical protein
VRKKKEKNKGRWRKIEGREMSRNGCKKEQERSIRGAVYFLRGR